MSGADLLEVGAILEQLAAGDLTEEVAAERLGWALDGRAPTCDTCATFRHCDAMCIFPGRPESQEDPHSVACHDYRKFDPRDVALPAAPRRSGSMLFKG